MPVSEDEFERPVVSSQPAMSKAEQRKSNKPIMEKRRRARINHCLNELKTLILDAMNKDPARHSKLEKADILEMTVKHLQQIQRQHLATAMATDPAVVMRFKSGFDECAAEVSRYIGRMGNVDDGVKQRLIAHLHRCVNSLQQVGVSQQHNIYSNQNCDKSTILIPSISSVPGDVNNNSNPTAERIHIPGGLQLIPSRLPTGELALLVPNSNQISSFLNAPLPSNGLQFQSMLSPTFGASLNKGPSAFTAVNKNVESASPTDTKPIKNDTYSVGTTFGTMQGKCDPESHKYSFGKFKNLLQKPPEPPDTMSTVSSSFQRKPADSTTSTHLAKEEVSSSFKPFHVEIPNSQMKAHITIPGYFDDLEKMQQKPNPNFTLNPNKSRSPQKIHARSYLAPESTLLGRYGKCDMGFEKLSKIEPLSVVTDCGIRPRSTETFQQTQSNTKYLACEESPMRPAKRPVSVGSVTHSPTLMEPPDKVSRISLNVMLRDGDAMVDRYSDRCQRISVIVEDVSKEAPVEGSGAQQQQQQQQQQQRDMWRPW